MIGKTIAHYKVGEKIGAGGMGEVYQATDTKLNREVALKVLPEQFAKDAERMVRFKREAQVLASLNHPNIAAIYGLEQEGDTQAIAMELVEGPTLSERIKEGALPLEEALNIAKQIADALESAHEQGVIHRDLKPANVKVKEDGQVKVLDFGLAKALEGELTEEEVGNSPTLSIAATKAGIILGTAAYMSPEQARGHKADRRADIWSFGVVLFEMLTGRRAFTGETISDILASVLKSDINWDALPTDTPPQIAKLLRRCLTATRKQRLQAIGEARIGLDEYLENPVDASVLMSAAFVAPSQPAWRTFLPWAAGALAVALVVSLWAPWRAGVAPGVLTRFSLEFPGLDSIQRGPCCGGPLGISPDGKRLAFTAFSGGRNQIYVRAMDQTVAVPLAGTENSTSPFFSPDGRWIGFFSDSKLKKISVEGGPSLTLCDIGSADIRGAAWGPEGTIAFAGTGREGLSVVSGEGGIPEPLTVLDTEKGELAHRWPTFLPDGKAVLFTVVDGEGLHVEALLLESGERRRLISHGANPLYADSGHLVYAQFEGADGSEQSGVILAVPFDPLRVEVTGSLVPVLEGVSVFSGGKANLTVSQNGSVVFLPGAGGGENRLVWFDRAGNQELLPETGRTFSMPRISPDGKTLAVSVLDGAGRDIWSYDFRRETFSRLTFDPGRESSPVWFPDGRRIAFASLDRKQILWVAADGSGSPEELLTGESPVHPYSFSDDGKTLTYIETAPLPNIHALNLEGKPEQKAALPDTFTNFDPALSPDGRWLAYTSTESGVEEIYVQEFPGPGGKWQISNGGGRGAAWSHDGRELFYLNGSQMMLVTVETEPQFSASRPRVLFVGDFPTFFGGRNYDINPDGKRFLIVQRTAPAAAETATPTLQVTLNWFDELRRRVPVD